MKECLGYLERIGAPHLVDPEIWRRPSAKFWKRLLGLREEYSPSVVEVLTLSMNHDGVGDCRVDFGTNNEASLFCGGGNAIFWLLLPDTTDIDGMLAVVARDKPVRQFALKVDAIMPRIIQALFPEGDAE